MREIEGDGKEEGGWFESCGHLWASRLVAGAQKNEIASELGVFLEAYVKEFFGHGATLSEEISALYESSVLHCGAEILRRLLGAAGFGFQLNVCQFEELLEDATRFLLAPKDCLKRAIGVRWGLGG